MRTYPKTWILLGSMALFAACQKVEELPLESNALLPLAVGNTWTYTDTMITTTSLSTIDTVVSEVTFSVLKETYIDTYNNSGKRKFRRLRGWELSSGIAGLPTFGIFPNQDTLWVDGWAPNFLYGFGNCPSVKGAMELAPNWLNSSGTVVSPGLASGLADGAEMPVHPIFHDLPRCIYQLGYVGSMPLVYTIVFEPLTYDADPANLTTEAGTFNCRNFGSQLWADGVGLVQFQYSGATAFLDENGAAVTGTLTWKRSLKSYQLN
jgi:hypothetical protein